VAFGPSQAQDDLTMGLFKRNPAKQLVKDGDVEGLLSLATSGDEVSRADALNSLPALNGAMSPEQRAAAHDIMTSAAADSSPDVRGQALFALWETEGGDAVDRVIQGLRDPDAGVRTMTAAMLGAGDPSVAADPLITLLQDDEAVVRQTAAESLASLGDPRAEAALNKAASDDPDAMVRAAAQTALDQLGSR
jgi:HEAT repeat protein